MKKIFVLLSSTILLIDLAYSQCATCATPNCIVASVADFATAESAHSSPNYATFCELYTPDIAGPATIESYHTITVGASGSFGAVVSTFAGGGCAVNRTFELFPTGSSCVPLDNISPVTTNANGSAYSNPEWSGLAAGDYILKITYDIPGGGCALQDHCVNYYSPAVGGGCGNCASPSCTIGDVPTYDDRFPPTGAQDCVTGLSETGTYVSYQTVTSNSIGFLGAYVQAMVTTGIDFVTITSNLYPVGSCGNVGSIIAPDGININGRSSTNGSWNPEWSTLTANTNYILETTFTIDPGVTLQEYCMDYYWKDIPVTPCDADAGEIN